MGLLAIAEQSQSNPTFIIGGTAMGLLATVPLCDCNGIVWDCKTIPKQSPFYYYGDCFGILQILGQPAIPFQSHPFYWRDRDGILCDRWQQVRSLGSSLRRANAFPAFSLRPFFLLSPISKARFQLHFFLYLSLLLHPTGLCVLKGLWGVKANS